MHMQMDFESFSLDGRLIRSLREANILTPTTLQRAAFPPLLEGRDLVLQAGPDTGRVLAWCLPVLHRLLSGAEGARAVVAVPGGDAGMGIEAEVRRTGRHAGFHVLVPAAGVERTGASYEMFSGEADLPDILIGMPAPLVHLIDGTRFPLDAVAVFVCDLTRPLEAADVEALGRLASRLPASCQRVIVTETADDQADSMIGLLARNPAIVIGTAGSAPLRDAETPEDAPPPPPPPRTTRSRRSHTQRRKGLADRPETWPIAHLGVTVLRNPSVDDLARLVRVESRGHTVVLVGAEDRGRALVDALASVLPGRAVRFLDEGDPLPGDDDGVTVGLRSARRREDLTANVLVLEAFPASADDYVSYIPVLRCEPGDRILTLVTPRDVGTQYQLRLSYGIRLLERRLPTDEEMDTVDQADAIRPLRELAGGVQPGDLALLARIRTMEQSDEILAAGLARLLEHLRQEDRPPVPVRRRQRRRSRTVEPEPEPEPADEPLIRAEALPQLERTASRRGGIPMVELELSCGSDDGVEAEYLAQWLQSRLAMRVSELGPIRVQPRRTFVTVPRERATEASMMLAGLTFGNRRVEVTGPPGGQGKA